MKYRELGQSELNVSTIAMGCWAIAGDAMWGPQDEQDAIDAIQTALDLGVNLFDTAEGYGSGASEALLARGLGDRRDEALIATKVSPSHLKHDQVIAACERSLQRLKTDRIDLYQIHWPNWDVPFDETMRALENLRDAGKVRVIGVSNFGPRDMRDMLAVGRFESNQLAYNLLMRAIEHEIVPLCREHEVGILCYSPIMQGLLAGKFAAPDEVPPERARSRLFSGDRPLARHGEPGCEAQVFEVIDALRDAARTYDHNPADIALAWCLHQPGVTSVLAGARDAEQIRANARAAAISLEPETLEQLDEATAPIKAYIGRNPDMWQSGDKVRMR